MFGPAIVIQFVGADDLASEAIEWFTQGNVSHVDIVLPGGELLGARNDHVGGKPPGVQVRPAGYARWPRVIRAELPALNQDMVDLAHRIALSQVGKPYDKEAILGFVTGRDWRDDAAWFCSELVCWSLERCGWFPYRLATPMNKLPPEMLLVACSARALVVV